MLLVLIVFGFFNYCFFKRFFYISIYFIFFQAPLVIRRPYDMSKNASFCGRQHPGSVASSSKMNCWGSDTNSDTRNWSLVFDFHAFPHGTGRGCVQVICVTSKLTCGFLPMCTYNSQCKSQCKPTKNLLQIFIILFTLPWLWKQIKVTAKRHENQTSKQNYHPVKFERTDFRVLEIQPVLKVFFGQLQERTN